MFLSSIPSLNCYQIHHIGQNPPQTNTLHNIIGTENTVHRLLHNSDTKSRLYLKEKLPLKKSLVLYTQDKTERMKWAGT